MKNLLIILLFVILGVSCQSNTDITEESTVNEDLTVIYTGDADVVQFKMFEGLSQVLKQDSVTRDFKGVLDIPNVNEAIFTYEIVVHKKDSLGHIVEFDPNKTLIKLNKNTAVENGERFLWIGNNRNDSYLENEELAGLLITKSITSKFLEDEREITVYTPKEVSSKIPIIYFTDGSVVNSYAPYIDRLISTNKIKPVKLIGIHTSSSNRYKEYVKGSSSNELFRRHQRFFYEEVVNTVENEIENWDGERYLYGFSNGAAFCMHEGINNPDRFEEIIAFSTADYIKNPLSLLSEEDFKKIEKLDPEAKEEILQYLKPIEFKFEDYPRFYLGAGRYEESIFKDNLEFLEFMKNNDIQVDFKEFVSGHDYNVWRIEFLEYLETRFNK